MAEFARRSVCHRSRFGRVRAARLAAGHGARVDGARRYGWAALVIRGLRAKKAVRVGSHIRTNRGPPAGFGWLIAGRFEWRRWSPTRQGDRAAGGIYNQQVRKSPCARIVKTRRGVRGAHTLRISRRDREGEIRADATEARPIIGTAIPGIETPVISRTKMIFT